MAIYVVPGTGERQEACLRNPRLELRLTLGEPLRQHGISHGLFAGTSSLWVPCGRGPCCGRVAPFAAHEQKGGQEPRCQPRRCYRASSVAGTALHQDSSARATIASVMFPGMWLAKPGSPTRAASAWSM